VTAYLTINGEQIGTDEATKLIRMLCEDAKQIAGIFHGMNRSDKFRKNWPSEYEYADANWKSFIKAARQMYAERLADPKTPPAEGRMMHLALVLQAQMGAVQEQDPRLQIAPNTQQFVGDPFENKKIIDRWGRQSNTLRELLLSSAAKPLH